MFLKVQLLGHPVPSVPQECSKQMRKCQLLRLFKKQTARGSLKCHLSHPDGLRQTGISIIPGRWPAGVFFRAPGIPSSGFLLYPFQLWQTDVMTSEQSVFLIRSTL